MAKTNTKVDPDLRDYALVTLMKAINRAKLLDEKRNNESETAVIKRYLRILAERDGDVFKSIADPAVKSELENLVIDIACEKDEKAADEKVKALMRSWRKSLLKTADEYKVISKGDCETVTVNAERVYAEVFKPFIDEHNNSRRNKKNQIDTGNFVKRVMNGDIGEEEESILFKSEKRLLKRLNERRQDTANKSLFIKPINKVFGSYKLDYKDGGNNSNVRQANKKVRSYFSYADAVTYRNQYKDDETARKPAPGSKEDFLKLLGCMADYGRRQIMSGSKDVETDLADFKKIIVKNYPDKNAEKIVNRALGTDGKADSKAQLAAFAEKSSAVYTQMLGGFVQLSLDKNNGNLNSNIAASVESFIDGLKKGSQDIQVFSFLDLAKDTGIGTVKQQQSGEQDCNADHKIPVGADLTLYLKMHPEEKATDPNELPLKRLLPMAERAAHLVDNISNHRLVLDRKVNNELEAGGSLDMGMKKDDSILAVRYSPAAVLKCVDQIAGKGTVAAKRLTQALQKYSASDKRGIITTTLALPEPDDLANFRRENTAKRESVLHMIIDKVSKMKI